MQLLKAAARSDLQFSGKGRSETGTAFILVPLKLLFLVPLQFLPSPPFPVRRADQEELLAAPTTTPPPLAKAAT